MWFSVSREGRGVREIIHNGEWRGERKGRILGVVFCKISHFALHFNFVKYLILHYTSIF